MNNDWFTFQNLKDICSNLSGLRLTRWAREKEYIFIKTTKEKVNYV